MASELRSWELWGSTVEAALETRMERLERKLVEVKRLLRKKHHARTMGQSPPRRERCRIEVDDRWDRGFRRTTRENCSSLSHHREERLSVPYSRDESSKHREGFFWGSRPPDSSWYGRHSPQCDGGQGRATIESGGRQTVRAHNREYDTRRGRREELFGCGRPPRKPPDVEITATVAANVLVKLVAAEEDRSASLNPPNPIPWVAPSQDSNLPPEEKEVKASPLPPNLEVGATAVETAADVWAEFKAGKLPLMEKQKEQRDGESSPPKTKGSGASPGTGLLCMTIHTPPPEQSDPEIGATSTDELSLEKMADEQAFFNFRMVKEIREVVGSVVEKELGMVRRPTKLPPPEPPDPRTAATIMEEGLVKMETAEHFPNRCGVSILQKRRRAKMKFHPIISFYNLMDLAHISDVSNFKLIIATEEPQGCLEKILTKTVNQILKQMGQAQNSFCKKGAESRSGLDVKCPLGVVQQPYSSLLANSSFSPLEPLLELPNNVKAGFLLGDVAGCPAALVRVPFPYAWDNPTINLNKNVAGSHGIGASLVIGAEIRGTRNASIVPEAMKEETNIDGNFGSLAFKNCMPRSHRMPLQFGILNGGAELLGGGFTNPLECIIVYSTSAALLVLYMKVHTSYFDAFHIERDEFYAPTAIPSTVNEVAIKSQGGGLELISLVYTHPLDSLRPWLLKATRRFKFQGKVLETSSIIVKQNFDWNEQVVLALEHSSNSQVKRLIEYKELVKDVAVMVMRAEHGTNNSVDEFVQEFASLKHVQHKKLVHFAEAGTKYRLGGCLYANSWSLMSEILDTGNFTTFGIKGAQTYGDAFGINYLKDRARELEIGSWDPGGHYYNASLLSSFSKIWDPGGRSFYFQKYGFAFQINRHVYMPSSLQPFIAQFPTYVSAADDSSSSPDPGITALLHMDQSHLFLSSSFVGEAPKAATAARPYAHC